MKEIRLDKDVVPISKFKGNAPAYISTINKTKQPILLTVNGVGTVAVVSYEDYKHVVKEENQITKLRKEAKKRTTNRKKKISGITDESILRTESRETPKKLFFQLNI